MRRGGRAVATALAGLLLGACAPHAPVMAPLDAGGCLAAYRAGLAAREQRARMATAEATLWTRGVAPCDTCAPARLPAVRADLAVLAPDGLRLRVFSLFGVAVDVALRGDSLTAYAPGAGIAVALDAVRDSLGPAEPGRWAGRLVAAAWRAPEAASRSWRDGGLELRWREDADSLAVTLAADGLPREARIWREGPAGARVRYARWEATDGVRWPVSWSLEALPDGPALDCRLEHVAFAALPDPTRLVVRVPAEARRVGAEEARRLFARLGLRR
jgi:hypothetical protein